MTPSMQSSLLWANRSLHADSRARINRREREREISTLSYLNTPLDIATIAANQATAAPASSASPVVQNIRLSLRETMESDQAITTALLKNTVVKGRLRLVLRPSFNSMPPAIQRATPAVMKANNHAPAFGPNHAGHANPHQPKRLPRLQ